MKAGSKRCGFLCCMICVFCFYFGIGTKVVHAETIKPVITMDGASIRTEGTQGLRFKVTISDFSQVKDYGIEIKYNNKTIAVSYKNGYEKLYSQDLVRDQAEYVAVVTGLQLEHITKDFEATGFVIYEENGQEKTDKTTTITRTIQQVAEAAGYEYDAGNNKWVEKGTIPATTETVVTEEVTEMSTTEELVTTESATELPTTEEVISTEETTEALTTEEITEVIATTEVNTTEVPATTETVTTEVPATTETSTTEESKEPIEVEEIGGYRIAKKSEGTSITENQDGSVTISFTNVYDAIYFEL